MKLALKDLLCIASIDNGLILKKLFYFMDHCKGFVSLIKMKSIYQRLTSVLGEIYQVSKE